MNDWDELDEGVFRRRYPELDQNIGLVVGSGGSLVIDSRSHPHHGRVLREDIARVSRLPVRWLVNTHWHWDHCFGNAVFPEAVILGHHRCRTALIEDGRRRLDELKRAEWFPADERSHLDEVSIVPPTLTFGEETSVWMGERRIRLRYYGLGHTDADIVVEVGDVTFAGDLVEEGSPPAFADSYPRSWVETLRALAPDLRSTVVPGHGDVVTTEFVATQADEIAAAVRGEAVFPEDVTAVLRARLDRSSP